MWVRILLRQLEEQNATRDDAIVCDQKVVEVGPKTRVKANSPGSHRDDT